MQWLIENKDLFEVLSFISTIIGFLIGSAAATFAALQIYYAKGTLKLAANSFELAKKDIHTRLKREAIVVAADKCEKYAKEILPALSNVTDLIAKAGISNDPWVLENNFLDDSSIRNWDTANLWLKKLRESSAGNETVEVLNLLESFSIYFVKGAADEQIAYPSIGASFCDYVNTFAPYLISLKQNKFPGQASGRFQNVATLYSLWSDRLKIEALESESNKINESLSKITPSKIPPIGLTS